MNKFVETLDGIWSCVRDFITDICFDKFVLDCDDTVIDELESLRIILETDDIELTEDCSKDALFIEKEIRRLLDVEKKYKSFISFAKAEGIFHIFDKGKR